MKEWNTKYNSFNSYKVFKHIEKWSSVVNDDRIDPPVFLSIDPNSGCNLKCKWCNASEALKYNKDKMTLSTVDNIVELLSKWNTRAVCIAGGGEPLLNENTPTLANKLIDSGVKVGIITNGTELNKYYKDLMRCEWIGVSIDAGYSETFSKLKGVKPEIFDKVLNNLKLINDYKKENNIILCQTTYKYLIHPSNYKELYQAIKNAKEVGCDVFHARPGGDPWFNLSSNKFQFDKEMIESANEQIEKARSEFEDDSFKVFGIVHKFTDNWEIKHSFKKCYAVSTNCFISSDGTIGLCCDRRGDKNLNISSVNKELYGDINTGWGSDKHKQIMKDIDISKCPRCTYSHVNELFENVIIHDKMLCDFI